MTTEDIQDRLKIAFKVKIAFPAGTVWLPEKHLDIDDWLTCLAETDENSFDENSFKELKIPAIRFLQNRWPIERLLELEWNDGRFDRRTIWSMYVGRRAYILLSGEIGYQLIAAIEPKSNLALYDAVIGKLLHNANFVPHHPIRIKIYRPDLLQNVETDTLNDPDLRPVLNPGSVRGLSESVDWLPAGSHPDKGWQNEGYLSKLLIGWIGDWIDLPVLGFWHTDA
jgi:hypothetical protein